MGAGAVTTRPSQLKIAESCGPRTTTKGKPLLHREFFEYRPEFKVWPGTNHKPEIGGSDHAIWRRIRLISFNVTIPADDQDRNLMRKLQGELPGILNWALEGLAQYRKNGLGYPDEIRAATEEYRGEMDPLRDFWKPPRAMTRPQPRPEPPYEKRMGRGVLITARNHSDRSESHSI